MFLPCNLNAAPSYDKRHIQTTVTSCILSSNTANLPFSGETVKTKCIRKYKQTDLYCAVNYSACRTVRVSCA